MLLGAVACSGGGTRPTTLPPVTATTPAADTSSAPPHHSRADDLAAVKAVVRKYYRLLNGSTTVANAKALAALMTRDCKCRRAAESVLSAAKKSQHYFGHATITDLIPNIDSATAADALVDYNSSRSGLRASDGRPISTVPGRQGIKVVIRLVKVGSAWRIFQIEIVDAGAAA